MPRVASPFGLTPRERELAGWLGEDLNFLQIAAQMGISRHTVNKHCLSIQAKLGVHSRHAAVALLSALGIPVLKSRPRTSGVVAKLSRGQNRKSASSREGTNNSMDPRPRVTAVPRANGLIC